MKIKKKKNTKCTHILYKGLMTPIQGQGFHRRVSKSCLGSPPPNKFGGHDIAGVLSNMTINTNNINPLY